MSGSAAPGTAVQINWALDEGFADIRLNTARLVDPARAGEERATAVEKALNLLDDGRSVVLYAVRGPDDTAIAGTRRRMQALNLDLTMMGRRLGTEQGAFCTPS